MTTLRVELRILGHTELSTAGSLTGGAVLRQPKRLALLAYLALATAEGFRRRDQIVALFWPDQDQLHARTQLRKALYSLRGVIGADALVARGDEEIRLNTNAVWCDAVAFRRCVDAGEWREALDLYRGDLLEGLFPGGVGQAFEEWLHEQRSALRELAARAAWQASSRADLAGDSDVAIALGRRALELVPDDEDGVRRLIAALDRHGDRAGALRLFTQWRDRLNAEFGMEPAPETRKLIRRVQAHRQGESVETPRSRPTGEAAASAPPSQGAVAATADPSPTPAFAQAAISPPRRWIRARIAAALGMIMILAVGAAAYWGGASPDADVAVLPLEVFEDAAASPIADGFAEELTTALAQENGVIVQSLVHTREALRARARRADIGDLLKVRHFVEGGVRRDSSRLRVTLRLVRAADLATVWARTFDVGSEDVLGAQRDIATSVVAGVVSALTAR